jgi:hypothetical protein
MKNEITDESPNPWRRENRRRFVWVKRNDARHKGDTIEIPKEHLEQTLKNHPTWQAMEEVDDAAVKRDVPVSEAPRADILQCPLCGMIAGSEEELAQHKGIHAEKWEPDEKPAKKPRKKTTATKK